MLLSLFFVLLICASAYFSSSETSMMGLNRYRLKHLKRKKHPVGVELDGYYAEIVQVKDNVIRTAKMRQRATLPVPETS